MTENDESTAAESERKRRLFRRLGKIVGVVLLLAIVLPFVIYAVPQVVGADSSYVVLSGSMQPTMNPGDVVVVKDVPADEIERGDIITFQRGEQTSPTTHRVIEVIQDGDGVAFRTAGDNSQSADRQSVTPAQVEGRVPVVAGIPFVIPLIGYVIRFASTQTGFVLLVAVPIGLLFLSEAWSLSKRLRVGNEHVDDSATGQTSESSEDPATEADRSDGAAGPQRTGKKGGSRQLDGDTDDRESAVSFTAPELQLGLLVLAAFVAYSVWVAIQTMEIWAFTVAGGVGTAFLLLSILYLAGRSGRSSEREVTAPEPTGQDPSSVREQFVVASARADALAVAVADTERDDRATRAVPSRAARVDGGEPTSQAKEETSDD